MRRTEAALWQPLTGIVLCCALGWFAFVREANVPVLALADLGVHELGHLLTFGFPDIVTAMAGSVLQVAVPWALAGYFLAVRRDVLGGAFCLPWAGTSAQNASVYVADAPYQALPLTGGSHDWAFVLGPDGFDVLHRAAEVAAAIRLGGLVLLLNALAVCATAIALGRMRGPRAGRRSDGRLDSQACLS